MLRASITLLLMIAAFNCNASQCVKVDLFVKHDVTLKNTNDHPCGVVATQCRTSLPMLHKYLDTIWAYELGVNGELVNKWPIPVDAQVYEVTDDSIVAAYPNYKGHLNGWEKPNFVRIQKSGRIKKNGPVKKSSFVMEDCTALVEKTLNNTDLICQKFKDATSGKLRILAYPTVCA